MAGNVHQDDPEKLKGTAIVECQKIIIDGCNAVTGWATVGQASNLTASTTHLEGTHSLEFDKDGVAGLDGYIEKTISSVNIGDFQTHAIGHTKVYLSDVSQVSKVFIRLGTDSSNYFQYDFTILEDGWMDLDFMLSHRTSQVGVGADLSDVTYVAAGVVMNANGNTLTDIRVDSIHVKRMLEALAFGAPSIELASRIRLQDNNTGRMLEVNSSHEALVHDADALTTLAQSNTETDDDKITGGATREAPIALMYGWDGTDWRRLCITANEDSYVKVMAVQGDPDLLKATVNIAADQSIKATQNDPDDLWVTAVNDPLSPLTVAQANAALLKATVTQAAKDRTVTNDVTTLEAQQLIPFEYDYIALTYTGVNLTGVVYKTGGSGGDTVATLALAYTDSVLDSITRT